MLLPERRVVFLPPRGPGCRAYRGSRVRAPAATGTAPGCSPSYSPPLRGPHGCSGSLPHTQTSTGKYRMSVQPIFPVKYPSALPQC